MRDTALCGLITKLSAWFSQTLGVDLATKNLGNIDARDLTITRICYKLLII